jgi:hypothetical protein
MGVRGLKRIIASFSHNWTISRDWDASYRGKSESYEHLSRVGIGRFQDFGITFGVESAEAGVQFDAEWCYYSLKRLMST